MSRTIRQKLDQLADMEKRNIQHIADFRDEEEQHEHWRSRLAWIEGYTTEKPDMRAFAIRSSSVTAGT